MVLWISRNLYYNYRVSDFFTLLYFSLNESIDFCFETDFEIASIEFNLIHSLHKHEIVYLIYPCPKYKIKPFMYLLHSYIDKSIIHMQQIVLKLSSYVTTKLVFNFINSLLWRISEVVLMCYNLLTTKPIVIFTDIGYQI